MKKIIIRGTLSLCILLPLQLKAQESKPQEPELKVVPDGRILIDAATYKSNNNAFSSGLAISELRFGAKANYENYKARIEFNFSNAVISIRDIILQREFNPMNSIYVGYFTHHYGLQSSSSSSMKIQLEEPTVNTILSDPRLLGVMYVHNGSNFLGTVSATVESDAIKEPTSTTGNQGWGVRSRLVYRPLHSEGKIFHVGISGAFQTPNWSTTPEQNHRSFTLSSPYPTKVAKVEALSATITDAKNQVKFTPELVAAYGPIGIEAQYFYNQINRSDSVAVKKYKASGAYATFRGLICGGKYKYSGAVGDIETPGKGSLEGVVSYNYTDMSDPKAEIRGGRMNDLSFTLNYYINKYMIWRFRYSYTDVRNRSKEENVHLNAFQTRLQIIF